MFSVTARARMLERGWSVASFLGFIRDSVVETLAQARARPALVRSVVRLAVWVYFATVAAAAPGYAVVSTMALLMRFAAYTAAGTVLFAAWAVSFVGLVDPGRSLGAANRLTIVRFLLIAPVLVSFTHGLYTVSLAFYLVLVLTDVVDGYVARRRNEQTQFGVFMDPLADVFSTAAVFAVFLAHGIVPAWLFAILMARYAMLIIGSVVLFVTIGPIHFRSTVPGKVVGVVQGVGVCVVIVCVFWNRSWLDVLAPVLFPVLGAAFSIIIVSQAMIGLRHIQSAAKGVEVDS